MCDKNRMIVQRGLELRAAKRREEAAKREADAKEAAHDAAERRMHAEINFQTKVRNLENEAAQAIERNEKRAADRRASRRSADAKAEAQWHMYLKRVLGAVLFVAVVHFLHAIDAVVLWLALVCTVLAGLYAVANGVAYITRNRHFWKEEKKEAMKC